MGVGGTDYILIFVINFCWYVDILEKLKEEDICYIILNFCFIIELYCLYSVS